MTNQQAADQGIIAEPEEEPVEPHTIVIQVVEHLAFDSWGRPKDQDTGEALDGRFRPGHRGNTPIAGVKLRIKLPDGKETEETTDENGRIEIKDQPIGEKCAVTFEAENADLNDSYFWFYETYSPMRPQNPMIDGEYTARQDMRCDPASLCDAQKVPALAKWRQPHKWIKKELMVGRSHVLSIYRPAVVIDTHMHINSGRCAPMPGVWDKASVLGWFRTRRVKLENIGKAYGVMVDGVLMKPAYGKVKQMAGGEPAEFQNGHYYRRHKMRNAMEMQKGKTFEIGDKFIKRYEKVHADLKDLAQYKDRHLQLHSLIMTMDMEYAHIDGYFGIKVYNGIYGPKPGRPDELDLEKPLHYWFPLHRGFRAAQYLPAAEQGDLADPAVMDQDQFDRLKVKKQLNRPLSGKPGAIVVRFAPCLVNDEETKIYEPWDKQVKYTRQVLLANPLKLLALYHFDPRRWQDRGLDEPFENADGKGIFAGFKLYSSQGFRPLDPRLPVLEEFYKRCVKKNLPVLNHCTPEGAYSFDRKEYIWFTHPNDSAEDEKQKEPYRQYLSQDPEEERRVMARHIIEQDGRRYYYPDHKAKAYFNDHFIAPNAWKPVLDKFPELSLCLAHFGGDTDLGRKWGAQIIEMISAKDSSFDSPKYLNLYADISSSFTTGRFRDYFMKKLVETPHLKYHIVFGTDWWLSILGENVDYPEYFTKAKHCLDALDTSLWTQFTLINPIRFMGLHWHIDRIARNVIEQRQVEAKKRPKVVDDLFPEEIEQIMKDAAFLKEAYEVHEYEEYTPWHTYVN